MYYYYFIIILSKKSKRLLNVLRLFVVGQLRILFPYTWPILPVHVFKHWSWPGRRVIFHAVRNDHVLQPLKDIFSLFRLMKLEEQLMLKIQMPNMESRPKSSRLIPCLVHSVNKLTSTTQSLDPLWKRSWKAIMVRNIYSWNKIMYNVFSASCFVVRAKPLLIKMVPKCKALSLSKQRESHNCQLAQAYQTSCIPWVKNTQNSDIIRFNNYFTPPLLPLNKRKMGGRLVSQALLC